MHVCEKEENKRRGRKSMCNDEKARKEVGEVYVCAEEKYEAERGKGREGKH